MAKTAYDIIIKRIVNELKLKRSSESYLPANVKPEKYTNIKVEGKGGCRFWRKNPYQNM